MAKITLSEEPTFIAPVPIPVPGAANAPVKFTFKHRTKAELQSHIRDVEARISEVNDVDLVMGIASGWELDDAFTKENVDRLLEKYHGAADAISQVYITELTRARLGN
jgi:hypothetical protein